MLFVILVLLLSIPAIQTRLGRYVTDKINEKNDTNINIQRVGLQFNGDIELKNIFIEDHKQDTLISIGELNTSIINVKKLTKNKFTFGDVDIYNLLLNIKTYEGEEDTNLDIFADKLDSSEKSENQFLLSSSDISISGSEFRITDENKETKNILDFNDLNMNATDFVILGSDVSARINKLAFIDQSGVRVNDMAANFKYTLYNMTFDDLTIQSVNSQLKGNLRFDYTREGIKHFEDSVLVSASFDDSVVSLDELNQFYNEFGKDQKVELKANVSGTLNNLNADNLYLKSAGRTVIDSDVNFLNLFNKEEDNFVMDAKFRELSSSYNDLKKLMPNVLGRALPSSLENLGGFTMEGNSVITSNTVKTVIDIETPLGFIIADLDMEKIDNIDDATYTGNIILDEFDLGTFLENEKIGNVSLNLDVNGQGFTVEKLNTFVEGQVYDLNYNEYYYSNIDISGNVQNQIFQGKLATKDDNIDFDFNGLVDFTGEEYNYDFVADVRHANLKALNFVQRDSVSIFSGLVNMKMQGTTVDNAYGSVSFQNTNYRNQDDNYFFEDFAVTSKFEDNIRYINANSPDIIEGELYGVFRFRDILKLTENSIGDIFTNYQPHIIQGQQYLNFNFKIYSKIAEVFLADLEIATNTTIRGHIESDATKFNVTFRSPKISLKDNYARNLSLNVNNSNPIYNTLIEADSIHSNVYDITNFSLVNVTETDSLLIKSEFKGGSNASDNFNLNFYYTIDEENRSVIGFKRSEIDFRGNDWTINGDNNQLNNIAFDKEFLNVVVSTFNLQHREEEITIFGTVKDANNKDLTLDFTDVDLEKVVPEIQDVLLQGKINGDINLQQMQGVYIPQSNIRISNFNVNEVNLGLFRANIVGNESLTNYNVDISLKNDPVESLLITGNIDVNDDSPTIDADFKFDQFTLEPLNPFGGENINHIRGLVEGNAKVTGSLRKPDISGNLFLDNAGMSIPYLNVDYVLDNQTVVELQEQKFIFNDAQLTDSDFDSSAILSGNISHDNFSTWALNLDVSSDKLLVLNTQDSEDALYYGTAFVDGLIEIDGPTDQLVIKAEVASEEGTVFKIPLNDTETFGDNSYIRFLTPEEKAARLRGEVLTERNVIKGLEMNFNLTLNKNAEVEIVLDRNSGSTIKGRGDGVLLAQINTNGKFNMYGSLVVLEGIYNFAYGGIIQKEFTVLPGGRLDWEGDPLQAQINLEAVYDDINANPSVLLDNPINRSLPVEVKIHLTERLEQPSIDFDISFPSADTSLNSELNYRLDNKESIEFQAISLLATGSFRSDKVNLGAQDALGLVSDRAASLLNELLSTGNDKYRIGFDIDPAEKTPDYETDSRAFVTLSTQISDKVLVNGKVGVPVGGVTETVVAGDVEIQVLLNEERTLSLKIFNRENDIRYFGEEVGYTQGIGISYNVEFDTLDELFKRLFKGNKDEDSLDQQKKEEDNGVPDYINFKASDTTSVKEKEQN